MDESMKKIIIFGIGDFAQLAHYYFTHDSDYEVCAFTVNKPYLKHNRFCNLPVIPFDEIETLYPASHYGMFVAIGYTQLNRVRANQVIAARAKSYELVSYVASANKTWPNLEYGQNCFIMENNIIQPYVHIQDNVIIWSGSLISHGVEIHRNTFIAAHVVIGGNTQIGENVFIGMNATIKDKISIASHSLIGAGALILKDTQEFGAYVTHATPLSSISAERLQSLL